MTLTPKPNGYEQRLRYGKGKRERFLLRCDADTAQAREPRMEAMARRLASCGNGTEAHNAKALELLREAASVASDDRKFAAVERVVEKYCAEVAGFPPLSATSSTLSTFRDVAEAWTSGKLREIHPDNVRKKAKVSHDKDRAHLAVFYPVLGSKPMAEITTDDTDRARRLIPQDVEPATRLDYLKALRRVFRYAVEPLRLIERSPLRDLPTLGKGRQFWFLYPDDEARVASCPKIPLLYRVLYGFLARNGTRIGETLQVTWDHIDRSGVIRLEASWTKTNRARYWRLDPDVLRALEAWRALTGAKATARVFGGRTGKLSPSTIRRRFHADLRAARIDRPELFARTSGEGSIRVHDWRGSFVTLALRAGRDVKWIMARTGHESIQVLQKYDRMVRHAEELELPPWYLPMHEAIPELRPHSAPIEHGPIVGHPWANYPNLPTDMGQFARTDWTREPGKTGEISREKAPSVSPISPDLPTSGPASFQGVGQTGTSGPPSASPPTAPPEGGPGGEDSPVERALAGALSVAIAEQQWELAKSIVSELSERRRARVAPTVPSIADARKKREEGK